MRRRLNGFRMRVDLPRPRVWKRFIVIDLPTEASATTSAGVLRHRLLRESEDVHGLFGLLAADQAGDEVELLRRTTDRGPDGERLVVGNATGCLLLAHQRLPFLSAA